jgi:hypothetical protein
MNDELMISSDKVTKKVNGSKKKVVATSTDAKQRYIYTRKDGEDFVANLIENLLLKCNQKDHGAFIDFATLVSHSLKLIKESDIIELKNNSLSMEERAMEEVNRFNNQHGTNYTMFEFVLNGLSKKSKKGVNQ